MAFDDVVYRHERIALQLSGGKDSLACLYLMCEHWDRLTVYWCNTGDAFPETVELMDEIRAQVPRFVEIAGQQPIVVEQFGLPSDIVPASCTPIGLIGSGRAGPLIQDRYSCCFRSMVIPTQQRMVEDGITLVIRGQKNADGLKWPTKSGDVQDGVEYLFPVEGWSDAQVLAYLREQGAPLPRFYEVMDSAPDCTTCSAYWETGAAKYLKRYHHENYVEVQRRLDVINAEVSESIQHFNTEVTA